jgi:spore maturation protein CgeB
MTDALNAVCQRMRSDWDRRVVHDFRFWMSEAYASDADMWASGERDYNIIRGDLIIPQTASSIALEIGCGVGRLLRSAARDFTRVIGIDLSVEAVSRAREFLADQTNVQIELGDGVSLCQIDTGSVDFVYSFASLGCVSAQILINYLLEIHRVLKPDGVSHLQLYIGAEQSIAIEDTLGLRSYDESRLREVLGQSGLKLKNVRPLEIGFQVSVPDMGLMAVVLEVEKIDQCGLATSKELLKILRDTPEPLAMIENDMGLESWVAYRHGCNLLEQGQNEKARQSLEYALSVARAGTTDIKDALDRLVNLHTPSQGNGLLYENLRALRKKFPDLVEPIENANTDHLEIIQTSEGPAIGVVKGFCLDHPEKPRKGAKRWAEQQRIEKGDVWIVGFGGGYHVEELVERINELGGQCCVSEPDVAVIKMALMYRDLRELIHQIHELRIGKEAGAYCNVKGALIVRPQTKALYPEFVERITINIRGEEGINKFRAAIGVLGPLQGGTLPIMHNVNVALSNLKQRSRCIDMSSFASIYGQIDSVLRSEERKNNLNNQMMNFLSSYILNYIEEAPVDILLCMALSPITPEGLRTLRKAGIVTALWFVEDYLRFTYWRQYVDCYDYVFTIQRGKCFEAFLEAGITNVRYLPCACDPALHRPMQLSKEEQERFGSPVSFVGAGYHNRRCMFLHLSDLPLRIWGTEWPNSAPYDRLVAEGGRRVTPDEYVRIFNATTINLNLHSSPERDGVDPGGDFVNPRTFELAATGAFQLVDARLHLGEVFEIGKEIIVFRNVEELRHQINYFLEHPYERKEIAERARKRALAEHTYDERVRQMLLAIYSDNYDRLKIKDYNNGWQRMMRRVSPESELYRRCAEGYERGFDPTLDSLAAGIMAGNGDLSETEQKLLFMFHIRQQMILMKAEETAQVGRKLS